MTGEYHLVRDKETLGTLRAYGGDFPWVYCKFEPTAAFEELRPLFDEYSRLLDGEDFSARDACFARIESLGLRLESAGGVRGPGEFSIVIRGDEASLR
jgi:hypothetical protein